jgi:hypothetical protein
MCRQYGLPAPQPWTKQRLAQSTSLKRSHHQEEQLVVDIPSSELVVNGLADFDRETLYSSLGLSPLAFEEVPTTPERTSPLALRVNQHASTPETLQSVSLNSPTSSPVLRKFRADVEQQSPNVDGMTLCLMLLDLCYKHLQDRCVVSL